MNGRSKGDDELTSGRRRIGPLFGERGFRCEFEEIVFDVGGTEGHARCESAKVKSAVGKRRRSECIGRGSTAGGRGRRSDGKGRGRILLRDVERLDVARAKGRSSRSSSGRS